MIKRTLSFVLALAMVVGFVPVFGVQASQTNDVVYVDESTSISELVDSGLVHMESPKEEPSIETVAPQPPLREELPQKVVSPAATICDCGRAEADIYSHSDDCALREYYINVCAGSASQIYELWRNADGTTCEFLEDYLKANAPEKWDEVVMLRDADAVPDDSQQEDAEAANRLSGEASATVDGITVDALGVPEGSSLTVKEPSADVVELVEQIVATAEDEPEQVFFYDISVQNQTDSDWQPEGTSVQMTLSIADLDLPQYTQIRIIHVDDEGNDSLITGTVDANGNIVFETDGFSTFAGFTVDFTYGSAMVSIPGKTSTTLGTLFQEMQMPLKASDVVDVQFTDYSLLTVTQEDGDWRLTSLKAFSSHETLTFTMADGNTYEFMVTDAQYASVSIGYGGEGTYEYDDNGYTRWFADGDGTLNTTGSITGNWRSYYWSSTAIVYIRGEGTFTIAIQPNGNLSRNAEECYVNLKQVRVFKGANVSFYVGTHFMTPDTGTYGSSAKPWSNMKTVVIQGTEDESLFYVQEGTLSLEGYKYVDANGEPQEIKLKLVGKGTKNTTTTTAQPLINLREGCTKLTVDGVIFSNSESGGIFSKANNMTLLKLTDCIFESSVRRNQVYTDGAWSYMNGGAIYLNEGAAEDPKTVDYFYLENCTFSGNIAGSHGGAIYMGDHIRMALVKNCTFENCSAGAGGGAISVRAAVGQLHVYGSTFTDCTAKKDGGAINVETLKLNSSTHYGRIYEVRLTNSVFTRCIATAEHSETNDGIGGGVNLCVQVNVVNVSGCTFDACESQGGSTNLAGGGMAFGYTNLGDTGMDPKGPMSLPWTDDLEYHKRDGGGFLLDANGNQILGDHDDDSSTPDAPIMELRHDTQNKRVVLGTAGTYRTSHQGWWMEDDTVADGGYYRQRTSFGAVNIGNSTKFINTKNTYQGGAFIVRTGCAMESLRMTDSTIDNCEVADKGSAIFFNNCIVGTADLLRCTISNCRVLETIHQGGGTVRTVGQTSIALTLDTCEFIGNQGNQAGGGLYWNAGLSRPTPDGQNLTTMASIKGCKFVGNKATGVEELQDDLLRYGGGIFCETQMTIQGCVFDGNESIIGGGVCMGVYNASYRMFEDGESTRLVLDSNTEFYNNIALNGGGIAIRANKSAALVDTENYAHTVEFTLGGAKFYNNTATANGGGIYYVAEYYENDELANAEVSRYTKTVNIDNGTVYGNQAGMNGGGIYMSSSNNTTITVSNGTIYNNTAGATDGGNGGGIYLTGTDATVLVSGGIIGAKLDGANQVAAPNVAKMVGTEGGNGGGIAVFGGARIEMSGGYVVYNQADRAGGGIAVHEQATMYISEGYVADNQAVFGGGISVNGAIGNPNSADETKQYGMYFDGGHVNNNKVIPGADGKAYGGGICLSNSATMKIDDGEIKNNMTASDLDGSDFAAGQEGGGIAACQNSDLTISGGIIDNNRAFHGGGIAVRGGSGVNMTGSVTVEDDDTVLQANGVVSNNWAEYYGGGIFIDTDNCTMVINNGYIYNNTSNAAGGGIFSGQNSVLEINNGRIESNTSEDGGGVYVFAGSAKISGGTIKGNHANLSGGGIRAQFANLTVEGGTFANNTAETFGGAITGYCDRLDNTYTYALRINITGGVFENNTAKTMGGAVCSEYGFVTISGGKFIGNHAQTANGGGIYMIRSDTVISEGLFQQNTAQNGGGVYVDISTISITGGTFQENTAARNGGALCSYQGNITLSGGTFTGNVATTSNGGAMYIDRSNATVSNGQFQNNAAKYGGGYFIDDSDVDFTGGTFVENKSNQGAGLFIRDSSVEIANITVSKNICTGEDDRYGADSLGNIYGGGVLIDALEGSCSVTINTGTFSENSAPYGGGLWIKNIHGNADRYVALTINGGEITNNAALIDGGGIFVHGGSTGTDEIYSSLTLNGGTISGNTAPGNGGGVWAGNMARVFINGTQDMHGVVTNNTANNGGGIYVTNGAQLTVHNGFIIKNNAVAPANASGLSTAKGNDLNLYGTGGGICVTAGISEDALTTFTLTGDDMAIYGNTATFAADDVFASGNNTKLNVPTVANMNLVGYDFKPEGWFEDYNTGDSAYAEGLNMIAANGGSGISILRYRNTSAIERYYMHIRPEYVSDDCVNRINAYAALTLGIPGAMDDTVVIDYGKNVAIQVWQNDMFMQTEDFAETIDDAGETVYNSYIGYQIPENVLDKDGFLYSSSAPETGDEFGIYPDVLTAGMNAVITNAKNGSIDYELNTMSVDDLDSFFYVVQHNGAWYYANVTVVPATSLYFEDNTAPIKYHTQADSQYDLLADWEVVGTSSEASQDQDRPGASVLDGLDADSIYGYDGSYATTTTYSNGAIHKVTVYRHTGVDSDNDGLCDECGTAVQFIHEYVPHSYSNQCSICLNTPDKHSQDVAAHECGEYKTYNEYCDYCGKWIGTHSTNARATFVFTGTGFDIISLSNQATGLVTVSVYQGTDNIIFEDDPSTPEWEATDPIKTWLVETYYEAGDTLYQVPVIKASDLPYGTYTVELYIAPSFIPREHGYYTADFYLDAIRIYDPMDIGGAKDQIAQDTYLADGENWPIYAEIRNMFINQGDLESETALEGILFIDGQDKPTLDTYRSWGPNNEIYLNPGQSVAFMLDGANYGENVAAVHVGLRGLTGEGHVLVQTKGESDAQKSTVLETDLGVTDLYYNISGAMNKVVTITNDGDAPISISTVKVTHTEAPSNGYNLRKIFTADLRTGNIALDILTPEALTDPVLKPKYPALSFEGMVSYNVFFTAEELGDLNGADLGLAVFDSYQPEGTVETAKDVILGATQIDGLYMVETKGIHAKYLGDTQYFRAFAKKADGSYIYSKMVSYSALDYAKNALEKSSDVKLKQLVVAMLNYGAEAQKFFGYNTEDLMNKNLTAEQQALVSNIDISTLNPVGKVDASKVGSFASNGGFAKKYPAISFKGAFEINYFMTPSNAVDGEMILYCWNEDTYNSATELTAENADKVVTMSLENGLYTASSDQIAAKDLDKTVYVAAIYKYNGETYCSGVLPYSIAAYCQKPTADVAALANAAAVYGCTAKEFFGR